MCDQLVALLSPDHSASIVWNDEDSELDTNSEDIDAGDSERLFTFEVAKTNEQEESAVSRPGFLVRLTLPFSCLRIISDAWQMNSSIVAPYDVPQDCPIDHSRFAPRLLPGETVQGLLTAVYNPPQIRTEIFYKQLCSPMALSEIL